MLEKVIQNAPFFIIIAYYILLIGLFVSKTFRNGFAEAHKEKSLHSWTRYLGTFVVFSAIVICLSQVAGGREVNVVLITTMLTIAFGGKVIQKQTENGGKFFSFGKDDKPKETTKPKEDEQINS